MFLRIIVLIKYGLLNTLRSSSSFFWMSIFPLIIFSMMTSVNNTGSQSWLPYYLVGLLVMQLYYGSVHFVGLTYLYDRKEGFLRRLALSHIRRGEYFLAITFSGFIFTLINIVVLVVVVHFLYQIPLPPNIPKVCILFYLLFLGFSSVSLLLFGLLKNPQSAPIIINVITYPLLFVSGIFWPAENFTGVLLTLSEISPLTYISRFLKSEYYTVSFGENLSFKISLIFIVFTLCVISTRYISYKKVE